MRIRKWAIAFLIIIMVLSIFTVWKDDVLGWVSKSVMEYHANQLAYPTEGAYYCEELGVELVFNNHDLSAKIASGENFRIHADYGARFISDISETPCIFLAYYHWDQIRDIITLQFEEYLYSYDPNIKYVFTRIG